MGPWQTIPLCFVNRASCGLLAETRGGLYEVNCVSGTVHHWLKLGRHLLFTCIEPGSAFLAPAPVRPSQGTEEQMWTAQFEGFLVRGAVIFSFMGEAQNSHLVPASAPPLKHRDEKLANFKKEII